jgi:hypothetical protein
MSYGGVFGAWPSIQRDEAAGVYAKLISQATRPSGAEMRKFAQS